MEECVKTRLFVICIVLVVLAGFAYGQKAPAPATPDAVDQTISDIQKQIDRNGYQWVPGRTSTAQMSLEEFTRLLGYKPPKGYDQWLDKQPRLTAKAGALYPTYFDWRDSAIVTPVKSQGNCGSCWAFAATGAFEAAIKKYDGIEYDLSEQQVLSCNFYNSGCDGGWAEPVYELYEHYGAVLESCMPYQADDNVPCTQGTCQVVARIAGWQYVANDVNAIKEAVLAGPVYTGFSVYDDFRYYSSGCYQHTYGPYLGGHAVVIVGWDDNSCGTGEGAWLCKNSWGNWWGGLAGYFWIKWGDCGIGSSTVLPLYPPAPVTVTYVGKAVTEASGDGDGTIEPGETATLAVDLRNIGPVTATSVKGTLETTHPGITVTDGEAIFPDLVSEIITRSDPPHFTFAVDPSVADGSQIDFTMIVTTDQGDTTLGFYELVGKYDTAFADDVEGSDNGWTHAGVYDDWLRDVPAGDCPTDPLAAHSPTKVWANNLSSGYAAYADNYLQSPPIDCSKLEKTRLQYARWLSVEKGIYDTARIYVNGNVVWENDVVNDHIDFGWMDHDIDISAYADDNPAVTIRFELISDGGLQLGGWNIDDPAVVGISMATSGDANGDGMINLADGVYVVNYVFRGGPAPTPLESGDANCDAVANLADAVYLINFVFKGGPPPGCP